MPTLPIVTDHQDRQTSRNTASIGARIPVVDRKPRSPPKLAPIQVDDTTERFPVSRLIVLADQTP
jgi:hypothetical protein